MTEAAAQPATLPVDTDPPPTAPPRSYVRRVIGDTLVRWGARVGLAWVGLLAIAAVFAPFIANSQPILLKTTDGQWSSPLLRHLTPTDVTLLVVFFVAIVLLLIPRLRFAWKFTAFIGVLVLTIVLSAIFVDPPTLVVHEKYRELEAAGQVAYVLRTPIPYSPTDRMRDRRTLETVLAPWWGAAEGSEAAKHDHWLGTELNGADVASRMIHAARIAMAIGFIATGIAAVLGVVIGGFMGYFSGVVDLFGMRLVEIAESIPQLFLLLTFVAFFPRNIYLMMIIIGATSWSGYARFIRAEFLKLRKQDFVQAGIACGLPLRSILFKHMLPNALAPVLVNASFGIASAILFETVLSFLGLGLVDEPSWGELLNQAVGPAGSISWSLAVFPGLAIFLSVFGFNLIGEAMRDAIDPHTKRAAA